MTETKGGNEVLGNGKLVFYAFLVFIGAMVLQGLLEGLLIISYAYLQGLNILTHTEELFNVLKKLMKVLVLITDFVFIFSSLMVFRRIYNPKVKLFPEKKTKLLLGLVAAFLGFLSAVLVTYLFAFILKFKVPKWFVEVSKPVDLPDFICWLGIIWLTVGPAEELFFRGVIQEYFTKWGGEVSGIIFSSLFFALAHTQFNLWVRFPGPFVTSLVYSYFYTKTKSLAPVWLAHSLHDTIAYALLFFTSVDPIKILNVLFSA